MKLFLYLRNTILQVNTRCLITYWKFSRQILQENTSSIFWLSNGVKGHIGTTIHIYASRLVLIPGHSTWYGLWISAGHHQLVRSDVYSCWLFCKHSNFFSIDANFRLSFCLSSRYISSLRISFSLFSFYTEARTTIQKMTYLDNLSFKKL